MIMPGILVHVLASVTNIKKLLNTGKTVNVCRVLLMIQYLRVMRLWIYQRQRIWKKDAEICLKKKNQKRKEYMKEYMNKHKKVSTKFCLKKTNKKKKNTKNRFKSTSEEDKQKHKEYLKEYRKNQSYNVLK